MTDSNNVFKIKGDGQDKFISFLKKLSFIPIIIFLLLVTGYTSFYVVQPKEAAVVLRFGEYHRTEGPGPHFKLPWDLEKVEIVPILEVSDMEFGFRTKKAGVKTEYVNRRFDHESIMLTGDLNVVDVEWVIQYRIKDRLLAPDAVKNYLFNVRNVRKNLYDISQAVMRSIIGDHTVTEAITGARNEIEIEAKDKMQEIIDTYKMGINLLSLKLQDVFPPEKVKPAFDQVNASVQGAKQIANMAQKQRKKLIQEETGKADQTINEAEAYKVDLINRAKGDTERFLALYNEYKKAPTITKKRLYFDHIQKVLRNTDKIYIVDPAVKGILPFMNIGGSQP